MPCWFRHPFTCPQDALVPFGFTLSAGYLDPHKLPHPGKKWRGFAMPHARHPTSCLPGKALWGRNSCAVVAQVMVEPHHMFDTPALVEEKFKVNLDRTWRLLVVSSDGRA